MNFFSFSSCLFMKEKWKKNRVVYFTWRTPPHLSFPAAPSVFHFNICVYVQWIRNHIKLPQQGNIETVYSKRKALRKNLAGVGAWEERHVFLLRLFFAVSKPVLEKDSGLAWRFVLEQLFFLANQNTSSDAITVSRNWKTQNIIIITVKYNIIILLV